MEKQWSCVSTLDQFWNYEFTVSKILTVSPACKEMVNMLFRNACGIFLCNNNTVTDIYTLHWKTMRVVCAIVVFLWLLCRKLSVGYYLQYGTVGGRRIGEVWPELKASETFSGELYQESIASSNLSDFNVQFSVSIFSVIYIGK